MTLGFEGTTLRLPKFGNRVELTGVCLQASAQNVTLRVLDGAGQIAFSSTCAAATPLVFAPIVDINGIIAPIPKDLVIEETDDVELVAAGAISTIAVISYQEATSG